MSWEIVKKSIEGTLPTYREFIADYVEDLDDLPMCASGSTCYVSGTGDTYVREADGDWVKKSSSGGGGGDGVTNFADLEDVEFPENPLEPYLFTGFNNKFIFETTRRIAPQLVRPTIDIFKENGQWTSNLTTVEDIQAFFDLEFNGIVGLDISTENVGNIAYVTNFASYSQDDDIVVFYNIPYINNNAEYMAIFKALIDANTGEVEVEKLHDITIYEPIG